MSNKGTALDRGTRAAWSEQETHSWAARGTLRR